MRVSFLAKGTIFIGAVVFEVRFLIVGYLNRYLSSLQLEQEVFVPSVYNHIKAVFECLHRRKDRITFLTDYHY